MGRHALAVLLAAVTTWSCTGGDLTGLPAATVAEPGFLTVEWSGTVARADIGVLIELEGPGIEAVRAPGYELYQSGAPGPPSDRRGGFPPDGSARAVPGAGPQPAPALPGPRRRGHGRGLRAQGRGRIPGGDHEQLTTPNVMGPRAYALCLVCVGGDWHSLNQREPDPRNPVSLVHGRVFLYDSWSGPMLG